MKVLVTGSTGVLGRNVVPRLVESGHEVRALVRRQEEAETYQHMGVETTLGWKPTFPSFRSGLTE